MAMLVVVVGLTLGPLFLVSLVKTSSVLCGFFGVIAIAYLG